MDSPGHPTVTKVLVQEAGWQCSRQCSRQLMTWGRGLAITTSPASSHTTGNPSASAPPVTAPPATTIPVTAPPVTASTPT